MTVHACPRTTGKDAAAIEGGGGEGEMEREGRWKEAEGAEGRGGEREEEMLGVG
jgi:hypothetical protein